MAVAAFRGHRRVLFECQRPASGESAEQPKTSGESTVPDTRRGAGPHITAVGITKGRISLGQLQKWRFGGGVADAVFELVQVALFDPGGIGGDPEEGHGDCGWVRSDSREGRRCEQEAPQDPQHEVSEP